MFLEMLKERLVRLLMEIFWRGISAQWRHGSEELWSCECIVILQHSYPFCLASSLVALTLNGKWHFQFNRLIGVGTLVAMSFLETKTTLPGNTDSSAQLRVAGMGKTFVSRPLGLIAGRGQLPHLSQNLVFREWEKQEHILIAFSKHGKWSQIVWKLPMLSGIHFHVCI